MNNEVEKSYSLKVEGNLLDLAVLKNFESDEDRTRQATLITKSIIDRVEQEPGKTFNIIVDLTKSSTGFVGEQERKIYMELAENHQLQKSAIIGGNFFVKALINLLVEASGKGYSLKLFDNRESALKWINQ